MSISNLLVPNNYNLFANEVTTNTLIIDGGSIVGPIVSNSFTPNVVIINGIQAGTLGALYGAYFQIGSQVFVNIKVAYTQTNPLTGRPIIQLNTLPVARTISGNFTSISDISGTAISDDDGNAEIVSGIPESVVGTQTIRCTWSTTVAGGVCRACFNFSYFI